MSAPLRVLIADDELIARKRLSRLLAAMPDVLVVGECVDGKSTLDRVREGGVDVVLLDIHMPGLSGIEAIELMPRPAPLVIFATAHSEHAVRAFEQDATDYLLKPVEASRLRRALDRARERLAANVSHDRQALELERLAVPTKNGIELVDPANVSHVLLDGELLSIVTVDGELFSDASLGDLLARLPPGRFERVHRRAIVNLAHVARLEPAPTGGYVARMRLGQLVEVSRKAARELRRRFAVH